jgi:hypothetical protein
MTYTVTAHHTSCAAPAQFGYRRLDQALAQARIFQARGLMVTLTDPRGFALAVDADDAAEQVFALMPAHP